MAVRTHYSQLHYCRPFLIKHSIASTVECKRVRTHPLFILIKRVQYHRGSYFSPYPDKCCRFNKVLFGIIPSTKLSVQYFPIGPYREAMSLETKLNWIKGNILVTLMVRRFTTIFAEHSSSSSTLQDLNCTKCSTYLMGNRPIPLGSTTLECIYLLGARRANIKRIAMTFTLTVTWL